MLFSPEVVLGLFNAFLPIITGIIKNHQAGNNGAMPTDAEVLAEFNANIDKYLAEGAEWRRTHPKSNTGTTL